MDTLSDHQLRAALWQARLLDSAGSASANVQLAQRLTATEGRYPASALTDALELLVEVKLTVAENGLYQVTEALSTIVKLDDDSALELLRRHCERAAERQGSRSIEEERMLVGSIGEELVAQQARAELDGATRSDLGQQVQRVSLIDDSLGFDVQAPTLDGRLRLMEVKSSVGASVGAFRFFISRNEYDVGTRHPTSWTFVACRVGEDRSVGSAVILGWAPASALRPYLPEDGNGRWSEALVRLPRSVLTPGLPPMV